MHGENLIAEERRRKSLAEDAIQTSERVSDSAKGKALAKARAGIDSLNFEKELAAIDSDIAHFDW